LSEQPSTVLFDGDCGICSWSRDFAERHDRDGKLRLVPFQLADLDALSPGLTLHEASRMAWFIKPDGTRFGGARCVFEVFKRLDGLWPVLGWLGANPVISTLVTPIYWLVANNRHRISARIGLTACAVPQRPESGAAPAASSPNTSIQIRDFSSP
jgi:predicted DCC family thiol-disulfide oxidoreductase YuxK